MYTDNKDIQIYTYSNDTGDAQVIVYHLFPGIKMAYLSVHMADFDFGFIGHKDRRNCVRIQYCAEGRIEQETNNEFFYLMPGDCLISTNDISPNKYKLPLNHYHGISIILDPDVEQNPLTEYLKYSGFSPADAIQNICKDKMHVVLRSCAAVKKFFEDPSLTNKHQHLDYVKAKLPELFYQLKYADSDHLHQTVHLVPRSQVELVQSISEYISQNLNSKISLKQLTQAFGVSDTYLQNAFRNVYGMPVISYIRTQKMQCAAQVLIHTSRTIDEIAEEFGYENESKFSAAFKRIIGDLPGVYRKEHTKINII